MEGADRSCFESIDLAIITEEDSGRFVRNWLRETLSARV